MKSVSKLNKFQPTESNSPLRVDTIEQLQAESDILLTYGASPTSNVSAPPKDSPGPTPLPQTPLRRTHQSLSSPLSTLSPGLSKVSERYSSRTNAGAVVVAYSTEGSVAPEDLAKRRWVANEHYRPLVETSSLGASENQLMFEKLREVAEVSEDAIMMMAERLSHVLGEDEAFSAMDLASNERIHCIGRICCDSEGKMNPASVLLEGGLELSSANVLRLDLSRLDRYALFPGQVVAASGVNTSGSTLLVDQIHVGPEPPFPSAQLTLTPADGPLQMVFACGPFTTSENLLYKPLEDLLTALCAAPPHVLVLVGPLLDAQPPLLLSGEMTETYAAIVARVLAMVEAGLPESTQVYLVASPRDVTSLGVYPAAPLTSGGRVTSLPDPAFLQVAGVGVALTSVDTLMHLGREELCVPSQQGDRLSRLTEHLLTQQHLYPLHPSPPSLSASTPLLYRHAALHLRPRLLILPSDVRHFAKDVGGTVAVNPERLAKGVGGGSYARVEVRPPAQEAGAPELLAAVCKI